MLKGSKFIAKIPSRLEFSSQQKDRNTLFLKGEGLRNIGYKDGTRQPENLVLRVTGGCGFISGSLWHFITKWDRHYYKMRQLFHYIMRQKFIIKRVGWFITKCHNFITKCHNLLQNARVITKCDFCYKMRQYNLIINFNIEFLKY